MLTENRNKLTEMDLFCSFTYIFELSASGFTWKVIYPTCLIGLGYFRFLVKKEDILYFQPVVAQSKQKLVLLEDSQELSQPNKTIKSVFWSNLT